MAAMGARSGSERGDLCWILVGKRKKELGKERGESKGELGKLGGFFGEKGQCFLSFLGLIQPLFRNSLLSLGLFFVQPAKAPL